MNWLDSSSFSGLLSQAQKSIDKVLDIPSDDTKSKKTGQNSETGISHSPKKQENKSEQKSSNSWLSGTDSFWSSFTQSVSSSPKKDTKEKNEKSFGENESLSNTKTTSDKENTNNTLQNESKLSTSKASNSKRNSKKKVSKKNAETSVSHLNENSSTTSQENEEGTKIETLCDPKVAQSGIEKPNNVNVTDGKIKYADSQTKSDFTNLKSFNNDILKIKSDNIVYESSKTGNNLSEKGSLKESNSERALKATPEKNESMFMTENVKNVKENQNFGNDMLGNESNDKMGSDAFENIDLQSSEETRTVNTQIENSKKFDVEIRNDNAVNNAIGYANEKAHEIKEEGFKKQEEVVAESFQNLDLFSSAPVAASTPCPGEKKGPLSHKTEDVEQMANLNDLHKENELPESLNAEQEMVVKLEGEAVKDSNIDSEETKPSKDLERPESKEQSDETNLKKENERLLQVIEVRESKLIELSKENLNLKDTNFVLRSQIEQLEEVHKSEDAELEQMKEEFTKRIGESEAKLQAAAKERDLFKKQLEETQRCLSSDIERQLKEFQSLLQQKDEQIAQLLEEGEKLSKQILQRNNNIKKLRVKEKELNAVNENQSTRLEEAETEIERLTGILKERDGHEKEQDDAIKKLNAYIKKQDDLIAKQKVELEESASKLPSLQTALDNAYKEITELHKVNAAKSNEVQEATLSVEMTAKEELRIALEKLKKESQKECDLLAMEVTDLQTQLNRSEQQAARREDNLRQEIADTQMRLQEAESRNQELTQSVSVATRPLLRQIENIQHSYGSQQTSWEKLEKNLTERLADAQSQLASAQEKERASTQRSIELSSKVASLESQVINYRQEKSRIEAEFELEKTKLEALEEFKSRESGKIEALKTMHAKQLETAMVEKSLLEQQLVVERTKYESEQKKLTKLEEKLRERSQKVEDILEAGNEDAGQQTAIDKRRRRNSSSSSILSLSETMSRSLPSGGTAVLEELRATIRRKEGELVSMQSVVSTLESSRESLTEELTTLMNANENLAKDNKQLRQIGKSFQEVQTKYNALLQMYGEKQEETEELKLDLQDIKNMYKAQIQELLSGR